MHARWGPVLYCSGSHVVLTTGRNALAVSRPVPSASCTAVASVHRCLRQEPRHEIELVVLQRQARMAQKWCLPVLLVERAPHEADPVSGESRRKLVVQKLVTARRILRRVRSVRK